MKHVLLFIFTLGIITLSAQTRDARWLHAINHQESRFLTGFSRTASYSSDIVSFGMPIGMVAYGFLGKDKDMLNRGMRSALSLGVSIAVTQTMKIVIDRERPGDRYPDYIDVRTRATSPSFPSGHSSTAAVTATTLCLEYPKWYVIAPATLWALSVGYSRMYLGVHYPSDVAAGLLLGAGSAALTHYTYKWINGKIQKNAALSSTALLSYRAVNAY